MKAKIMSQSQESLKRIKCAETEIIKMTKTNRAKTRWSH